MTVDPTPPGLRPLQTQLVQMLMGRMSGQGRSSVPTYGSALNNIQTQLYGVNPRTPPQSTSGNGGTVSNPPPSNPNTPNTPSNPDQPNVPRRPRGPILNPLSPFIPTYAQINPGMMYPSSYGQTQQQSNPLAPTDLAGMSSLNRPLLMDQSAYQGPQGYYNGLGQWQDTGGGGTTPTLDNTRGGPIGSMQGSTSPWAIPTFGAVMNGSGLIRANNNPYGWML